MDRKTTLLATRGARARRQRLAMARIFREVYGYFPGSRIQWGRAARLQQFGLEMQRGLARMQEMLRPVAEFAGIAWRVDARVHSPKEAARV